MNTALVLAFLFFAGALIGWILEFFFRNLISHNGPRNKFFINPGFCHGPYLPIYGIGVMVMFTISHIAINKFEHPSAILTVLLIGLCMTLIELVGGLVLLDTINLRLWDYTNEPYNYRGVICPKFSIIWTVLGALFYLLVYPLCIDGIYWLASNLAFSFFIGFFYGIFLIDLVDSTQIVTSIKKFGDEHDVVVKFEELKQTIQDHKAERKEKLQFFDQVLREKDPLIIFLSEHKEVHEKKKAAKEKEA